MNANILSELRELVRESGESDEVLLHAVFMLKNFSPEEIRDGLREGFPDPPPTCATPSPHAIISPEGVIVRVLQGNESPDDMRKLVICDVQQRYGIPEMKKAIASGVPIEQIVVRSFRLLIEMKVKYKVESLVSSNILPAQGSKDEQ